MNKQTLKARLEAHETLIGRLTQRLTDIEHKTNNLPAIESLETISAKYRDLNTLGNNIAGKINSTADRIENHLDDVIDLIKAVSKELHKAEERLFNAIGHNHVSMTSQFTNMRSILTLKDKDYPPPAKPKTRGRPRKPANGPQPKEKTDAIQNPLEND